MPAPQPAVAAALELIDEAFEKKAWHGPNLRGTIRGLGAAEAAWRPGPGRHNIRELVVHAAYWKYAVRRRLTGEKRGSFALEGSNWFARADEPDEAGWAADVRLLVDEHRRLRVVVAGLLDKDLARPSPGQKGATVRVLVRGIAAHDLYHAGQVQLLKRLRS